MKTRLFDITDAELLAISNDDLNDAIRLEAINRGIAPPVPLSEAIRSSEWTGYNRSAETVVVYEIMVPARYGECRATGHAYLSEALATRALEGIVGVEGVGYPGVPTIISGTAMVRMTPIGVSASESKCVKFQEFVERDDREFKALVDECMERVSTVRQNAYNKRVNSERRAEYLRLSNNDETIARAFWAKAERTEWPES